MTAIVSKTLAERIEDLLPQTQCTKCGYPACRPYAEAIAAGEASYDRCPPGGEEGVARIAALLGKPAIALDTTHGDERPRPLAVIDENVCIGCTLCMQACPVDAIVGAAKQMHVVIPELCTGCDLCVSSCPVNCIAMISVTGDATGWHAWSQQQADEARARHDRRLARGQRDASAESGTSATSGAPADDPEAKKRAIIQAALERARKKKEEMAKSGMGPKNTEHVSAAVQVQIDVAEARRARLGLGERADTRPRGPYDEDPAGGESSPNLSHDGDPAATS